MTEPTSPNPEASFNEPATEADLADSFGLMRSGDTLSLRYNVRWEDHLAYYLYYLNASPIQRRDYYLFWLARPGALLVSFSVPLFFVDPNQQGMLWKFLVGGWLLAFGLFLSYPWRYRNAMRRFVRRQYQPGQSRLLRLEVSPAKLSIHSQLIETHLRWPAIDRISRTEQALYVFTNDDLAYILPVHAFRDASEMDELFHVMWSHKHQG